MLIGLMGVLYTMVSWWRDVIIEANSGDHTPVVQLHHRYGMILFIASEVMFFVAWFWAYFDASLYPGEAIQFSRTELTGGHWPPDGIETFDPWHLPLINTLILLTSGTTVTWATMHCLRIIVKSLNGVSSSLLGLALYSRFSKSMNTSTQLSAFPVIFMVRLSLWQPGFMVSM